MIPILGIIVWAVCCSCGYAEEVSNIFSTPDFQGFLEPLLTVGTLQSREVAIKEGNRLMDSPIFSRLIYESENLNLTFQCQENIRYFLSGVHDMKPWALRLIDASGKSIDGILYGTFSAFGSYEECVHTIAKNTVSNSTKEQVFRGQYCTIDAIPFSFQKNTFSQSNILSFANEVLLEKTENSDWEIDFSVVQFLALRLGVCVPSGCTTEDIDKVFKKAGGLISLNATTLQCEVLEDKNYSPFALFTILWYFMFAFLVFIGSSIEAFGKNKNVLLKYKTVRGLLSFSLITNLRKLLNTEKNSDSVDCLHGIRFLSAAWVILGHSYIIRDYHTYHDLRNFLVYREELSFQFIGNSYNVVDTFFFISGLLLCYRLLKQVKIDGLSNVKVYVLLRIWRIWPLYIHVLMYKCWMTLENGHVYHEVKYKNIKACAINWWKNLLFIHNFDRWEDMCLTHTWYLSVDFQLYLGALLVIFLVVRSPRIGIFIGSLGILFSIFYSGFSTYINDYPPSFLLTGFDNKKKSLFTSKFFFNPFPHAAPYYMGVLAGYLLAMKPGLKISPTLQALGWPLAFFLNCSVLYGVVWWNRGIKPTVFLTVLYASLSKSAWALGIAWMTVSCITGHGGVVNSILSWKAFVPLSRLTYAVYLVHPFVQLFIRSQVSTHLHASHLFMVWMFLGDLCASFAVAALASMMFEAPFFSLEKLLFSRNAEYSNKNTISGKSDVKVSVHVE